MCVGQNDKTQGARVDVMTREDLFRFEGVPKPGGPDPEEELSTVIGDVAAHGVGEFVRGLGAWGRQAGLTMEQNVGEYLQEERQAVPGRHEVDTFRKDVNTLRDDVARFEARLAAAEKEREL